MSTQIIESLTFNQATPDTLNLLRAFNEQKRCTFLTSSNYIHSETAKLSYLLSFKLGQASAQQEAYRSFFVNSSLEALSGAIKLARQTSVRYQKHDQGWVLLVDEKDRFQPFLNPTGAGNEEGLAPNVQFVSSIAEALQIISQRKWSALLHVRYSGDRCQDDLVKLVTHARLKGATVVSCDSELELTDPHFFEHGYAPDVVVYGENLTDRQLPFGCFTMTKQAHAIWNNDVDCFAQTSTFGGNRLCASAVLLAMDKHGLVSEIHREAFRKIDSSFPTTIEYWGKYVNPGMAKLASIFGMDMDVREASGGRLYMQDGREVIDCSGGFGSNLRGHNPPDLLATLAEHDPKHDYFADLEQILTSLTKFSHAFPAVSGATAVDIAATLGMLANPERKKVVTFIGNFSGKTLFALNFSKYGPQLTESDKDAFQPYYSELVYIDPFGENAEAELTQVLRKGDVALVWFEMVRGGMCEMLPAGILSLIDELKDECGYLIGVDEVLTGGWRTGENYLTHQKTVLGSDIVSVGKTLSDMTVPMAAVLVKDDVYRRARQSNLKHVERLSRHYRNNLISHISFNALKRVLGDEQRTVFLNNQRAIEKGLKEIVASSRVFSSIRGQGALLLLVMNKKYFPFHHRSKLGNLLEMAMSHLIFVRCGVFVFLLRFLHRVSTDESDAQELILRLKQGIADITPFMVYRYTLSRILFQKFPRFALWIEGGVAKVDNEFWADKVTQSIAKHWQP
jgi:acetylornithine/succinyldiaminopimelate/putrescine aminotransferase